MRVPGSAGFGSKLIRRIIEADFNAAVEIIYDPLGMICRFTTPMENLGVTTSGSYFTA